LWGECPCPNRGCKRGITRLLENLKKAIGDKDEDVSNSALIAFEYLSYLRRKRNVSVGKTAPKHKIRL